MKHFILLKAAQSARKNYILWLIMIGLLCVLSFIINDGIDKNIMLTAFLLSGGAYIMSVQPKY